MNEIKLKSSAQTWGWVLFAISSVTFLVPFAFVPRSDAVSFWDSEVPSLSGLSLPVLIPAIILLIANSTRLRWDRERIIRGRGLLAVSLSMRQIQAAKISRPVSPGGRVVLELESYEEDRELPRHHRYVGGVELAQLLYVIARNAPWSRLQISERNKYKTWMDSDLSRDEGWVRLPGEFPAPPEKEADASPITPSPESTVADGVEHTRPGTPVSHDALEVANKPHKSCVLAIVGLFASSLFVMFAVFFVGQTMLTLFALFLMGQAVYSMWKVFAELPTLIEWEPDVARVRFAQHVQVFRFDEVREVRAIGLLHGWGRISLVISGGLGGAQARRMKITGGRELEKFLRLLMERAPKARVVSKGPNRFGTEVDTDLRTLEGPWPGSGTHATAAGGQETAPP